MNTDIGDVKNLWSAALGFGIGTPAAAKTATLEEDDGANPRTIFTTAAFYIEYETFHRSSSLRLMTSSCTSLARETNSAL